MEVIPVRIKNIFTLKKLYEHTTFLLFLPSNKFILKSPPIAIYLIGLLHFPISIAIFAGLYTRKMRFKLGYFYHTPNRLSILSFQINDIIIYHFFTVGGNQLL